LVGRVEPAPSAYECAARVQGATLSPTYAVGLR